MERFSFQLGAWWAELGPHYDSPNESVIPPVEIAAPSRLRGESPAFCPPLAIRSANRPARPLPPHPSGAIIIVKLR